MSTLPPFLREFDDYDTARTNIHDGVLSALKEKFPVDDGTHRLVLKNVRFDGPTSYTLKQQKDALLKDRNMHSVVKGTWQLQDSKTGDVLDERDDAVMHVPYLTQRGTFINNGSEYTVVNQARLKPGVYTRKQVSGNYEAHFNVKSGTGAGFRLWMEPETGIFRVKVGQANIPLYPLLNMLGVQDGDMEKSWGKDMLSLNRAKVDRQAQQKLFSKFLPEGKVFLSDADRVTALRDALGKSELDPYVVEQTLGLAGTKAVTPQVLLRTAQKLVNIHRGDEQVDDRDDIRFTNVLGVEDLVTERIQKDAGRTARTLLWKAKRDKNLRRVGRLALNPYIESLMYNSGLASPLEETNPVQLLEQANRVTRFGEGGIGDPEAVLEGARNVNPSQLGFVDPISGPESEKVGVDVRLAYRTFKGKDQQIYAEFRNAKTGKIEYLKPEDMSGKTVAFPDSENEDGTMVANVNGKIQRVPAKDVDYVVPSLAHMVNYNLNLANMMTGFQPARAFYSNKYFSQYIPMQNGEPPLVQTLTPDGKHTFHELIGRKVASLTAKASGVVSRVSGDKITVKGDDGRSYTYDITEDFPFNRMTSISYYPLVKAGDTVKEGAMLAHSNFSDKATGALNMGRNLRIAVVPYKGLSNNDAYVISESAAKKMTTERMFEAAQGTDNDTHIGRTKFLSLFPKSYSSTQLDTINDEGVVKPGTMVQKGDPLVLAVRPRTLSTKDAMLGKLHRLLSQAHSDSSVTWDHAEPGVVIDSINTPRGAKVYVKSFSPVKEGDKLCLTGDHEVLLETGWINIKNVKPGDRALSINASGNLEFVSVTSNHISYVDEHIVDTSTEDIDLSVTRNHKMYASSETAENKRKFELTPVSYLMGQDSLYSRTGKNVNSDNLDHGDAELRTIAAMCLDVKEEPCHDNLTTFAFNLSARQAHIVVNSLFIDPDVVVSSKIQADNITCFAIAAGFAVKQYKASGKYHLKLVDHEILVVGKQNYTQRKYRGPVYGPELHRNHTIYVRRNGKCCWTGNSNMGASKGVVGSIVEDSKMPRDPVTNEPYDLLFNPMVVQSRIAPNQLVEMQLAKIAKKTGVPYRLPQVPPPEGWSEFARNELKKYGLGSTEDVFDPDTGRTIKGVTTGNMYYSAFHHLAEKKLTGRNVGSYTSEDLPAKGGDEYAQAQRFGGLDMTAALSHNASAVIKDVLMVRGTKNEEYWKALKYGRPVPEPARPMIYDKFFNLLKAGGINTSQKGDIISLMPMTDKAISALTGNRQIRSGEQITNKMVPIDGGLFDIGQTGGLAGNNWAAIHLPEPIPNPVMQEPIMKVLGMTERQMMDVVLGKTPLNGKTGGTAVRDALEAINVDKELDRLKEKAKKSRGAVRDNAIKAMGYLDAARKAGISPSEWVISKVPVIPPMLRPISRIGEVKLINDMNELYADVAETANHIRDLKGQVGDRSLYEERDRMYNAVTAAFGLGEPINPEGKAKRLKGAIKIITGDTAKSGLFQSRLIARPVDVVGRAVIVPDPSLGMDEVGIPEEEAWHLYKSFVTRRLVRRGYTPERALKAIENKEPVAAEMLSQEMDDRPLIIDRAPAWHKFSLLAVKGRPVKSDTMRVSPLIAGGFNFDHDGDTMSFHVPVSDKAVKQAKERMMPSRNLFKTSDLRSVMPKPIHEMSMGAYRASTAAPTNKVPHKFKTVEQAMGAYRTGKINLGDLVEIG